MLCFAKCSSVYLEAGLAKKDTNTIVAGLRKQTKECAADQMCMDNIPVGLDEFDNLLSLSTSLLSLLLFSVFLVYLYRNRIAPNTKSAL